MADNQSNGNCPGSNGQPELVATPSGGQGNGLSFEEASNSGPPPTVANDFIESSELAQLLFGSGHHHLPSVDELDYFSEFPVQIVGLPDDWEIEDIWSIEQIEALQEAEDERVLEIANEYMFRARLMDEFGADTEEEELIDNQQELLDGENNAANDG